MRLVRQQLRSDTGWVYRKVNVTVYLSDGTTLANLYNGDSSPYSNPCLTSEEGYVEFYVQNEVLSLTYKASQGFQDSPLRPLPVGIVTTNTNTDKLIDSGIAQETIFLGNAVRVNSTGEVYKVDGANALHAGTCIGLANQSVLAGQNIEFTTFGIYDKAAFAFDAGKTVFIGVDGVLTQVVPVAGTLAFSQAVGIAKSATKIVVSIEPAIELNGD